MEDLKVCRMCLDMDVKMFDLVHPLETYLESVMGGNLMRSPQMPQYACWQCAALVKKFYKFQQKCQQGQSLLHKFSTSLGLINRESILNLNRKSLCLNSNLTIKQNLEENILTVVSDEDSLPNYKFKVEVKEEPLSPTSTVPNLSYNLHDIKIEFDNDFVSGGGVSSDDEPLIAHKVIKVEEEKKEGLKVKNLGKKGKKRKKRRKSVSDYDDDSDFSGDEHVENSENIEEAEEEPIDEENNRECRKVGRPLNTDINEYCTVITLSTEEQKAEIVKRQKSTNYIKSTFKCNLCFKGFNDDNAWKHHCSKHDPSLGIECEICRMRYKDKRALQRHMAYHDRKYVCKTCSYVSLNLTQAKHHQRWHKGHTYVCQHCNEVSTKWTSHLSHLRIKHPSEFICNVCGYSYISKLGLSMHKIMMHKEEIKKEDLESGPFCEECNMRFVSEEAYKRHMVMCTNHTNANNVDLGCKDCGNFFSSKEELRIHHRKEHPRIRAKNHGANQKRTCEHCQEEVPNAREYWFHFRRAHPDKKYPIQKDHVCDECGRTFRFKIELEYHKRTHTEERGFKCDQCPKAFFNKMNLQMHEKTHSDNRPYPCSVCSKAFKSNGALNRHFRSHSGVKPYECETCGKAFNQSNSRKLHIKTVHLKQPDPYRPSKKRPKRKKQAKRGKKEEKKTSDLPAVVTPLGPVQGDAECQATDTPAGDVNPVATSDAEAVDLTSHSKQSVC